MRTLLRDAFSALGLTELYALILFAPLLHARHMAVYHWTGTAGALFFPTFLDVALLSVGLMGVLQAARRWPRPGAFLWAAVLLVTPWVTVTEWDLVSRSGSHLWVNGLIYIAYAVLLLATVARLRSFALAWRSAIAFTSTLLLFFGIGGMLLLGELGWLAWAARGLNDPRPMGQTGAALRRPRILWIVFDELSYRQIYERPFPGLKLPAFHALRAQSTVLSQVAPAGIYTDSVLPALMTGSAIDRVRSSGAGELSVHHAVADTWRTFDAHRTVFQDAGDAGYRTAVVGWYLPYCRLLPAVLDRCVSSYDISAKSGMSPASSIGANMLHPAANVVGAIVPFVPLAPREAALHIADYERLRQASEAVLGDPSINFVLLHLPVPHLGGIYKRASGRLTTGPATYLDNLALADQCLGQLRAALEQRGEWDETTVVLMGDHSWRTTPIFKAETGWSTEEEAASEGGTFDPRPAYVVKLPGQRQECTLEHPFSALRTRALLDGLMRGEIRSPEQLAAWVQGRETAASQAGTEFVRCRGSVAVEPGSGPRKPSGDQAQTATRRGRHVPG